MPIKNYTTIVKVDDSIQTIQKSLARAGASAIMIEYGPEANVEVITFKLRMPHGEVAFRLPGRVDGVLLALQRQKVRAQFRTRTHAEKVAWRIVKDWVTAQIAIVQAEIASMDEVFLPYADAGNGQTLYQKMAADPGNLLPAPKA